ncbi:cysteine dioxygenase [Brevibacillus parabrevis]|uniref:cysteine dioxygenase n=1 Tax=Brevibacillus parabrevis TaxID=54914 RepID=UPI0009FB9965|nr:cysteine dioxygenase family protein [Brevibacillus parabrevis]
MNLERLERAFGSLVCPSPTELWQAVASLAICPEDIASLVPQPEQLPYGRKILYLTPHVEVVLIHLPARQESIPHNHGDSFGWEWVISGTLTNVVYLPADREDEVFRAQTTHVSAGDCYYVAPGEIHAICNSTDGPVLSLNVYTPPLQNSRQYHAVQSPT